MPLHSLYTIQAAYTFLHSSSETREKLFKNINYYQKYALEKNLAGGKSESPIQYILCKGNTESLNLSKALQNEGLDVRPILSPTVPEGKERLRICLHAFNEEIEIKTLLDGIMNFKK